MLPIDIRAMVPGDRAFVMSSWLNSYRSASEFGTALRKTVYYSHYRPVVAALVDSCHVAVATTVVDGEESICGWLCYDRDGVTAHYAYVKQPFRRHGILGLLLEAAGLDWNVRYTHETRMALKVAEGKPGMLLDQYAILREAT